MKLVKENINEEIKHLPGKSDSEIVELFIENVDVHDYIWPLQDNLKNEGIDRDFIDRLSPADEKKLKEAIKEILDSALEYFFS